MFAGELNTIVYIHMTTAFTGPRDGGAGSAADAPGGPEVGEQIPERIATTYTYSAITLFLFHVISIPLMFGTSNFHPIDIFYP